jgi:adenylate kinase family enzyme
MLPTNTFLASNFPWILTATAIMGTTWRYVLMVFSWIRGLLITRVHIQDHNTTWRLTGYFATEMKPAKFSDANYKIGNRYVYRVKRSMFVAFKTFGNGTLYFHKDSKFPILVTGAKGDKDRNEGMASMTVTFVRGTFSFEKLVVDVANKANAESLNKEDRHDRFRVRKHFGTATRARRGSELKSSNNAPDVAESHDSQEERSLLPLNFTQADFMPEKETKSFAGLSYSPEILKKIDYIRHWKKSAEWFNKRNIPWTRSIRLRGGPGTGKSSFARAIAYDLNMPIHIIDLSTMTNEELSETWDDVVRDAPSIALFEDIDRLFDKDKMFIPKELTLDCLLNCISGVSESNGVLTITTVNFPERLDIALGVIQEDGKSSRPGRLDFEIVFNELSEDCRRDIASRILDEYPEEMERIIGEGSGDTGAQFTQRCTEAATNLYWAAFDREALELNKSMSLSANSKLSLSNSSLASLTN